MAKDVGQTLGLTVRATDTTGTTAAYAPIAGLVAASSSAVTASAQPPLDGDPIVGQPLKVEAVKWSSTAAATPTTYAWLRCNANGRVCVAIPSQTADSYTLTADDLTHTVVAVVQAGAQASALTIASALVN